MKVLTSPALGVTGVTGTESPDNCFPRPLYRCPNDTLTFMKRRGRNLVGLVFSHLPPHTNGKKSLFVVRQFVVGVSVCLCDHVSLHKSPLTFGSLDCSLWNFQDPLKSLQLIFGRVISTPRPSGLSLDPEKWVFCQIYLLLKFWDSGVWSLFRFFGTFSLGVVWCSVVWCGVVCWGAVWWGGVGWGLWRYAFFTIKKCTST